MQRKVLVIEDSAISLNLVTKLVKKAQLIPICAESLSAAKHLFSHANPEEFLCAVVDFNLPDAPHGEAIDYAIKSYVPTIVITGQLDEETRDFVLSKEVVDYIPKENAQVYDYLSRLMARLEKNKQIGILVVDDSRVSRNTMASLLRRHNYQTFEASNAEDGLEIIQQHPKIQLVVTDFQVSGMNGTALVAELRKSFSKEKLAILGVSSGNSSLLSARFIKSGANDFLHKPFCHEEFLVRITQNVEYIEQVEAIRRAANSDYLTGLPNRRHFFYSVNHIHSSQQAVVALIDLDHFKLINDNYGHDAGDKVLKEVAKLLATRFGDALVSRFGGEEFCIYLANHDPIDALQRLDEFRVAISKRNIRFHKNSLSVTTSIGVTTQGADSIDNMLSTADMLLYNAKEQGRNQLVHDHNDLNNN